MKKLVLMVLVLALFTLAGRSVSACSCGDVKGPIVFKDNAPAPDSEAVKKWRLEQTDFCFFHWIGCQDRKGKSEVSGV